MPDNTSAAEGSRSQREPSQRRITGQVEVHNHQGGSALLDICSADLENRSAVIVTISVLATVQYMPLTKPLVACPSGPSWKLLTLTYRMWVATNLRYAHTVIPVAPSLTAFSLLAGAGGFRDVCIMWKAILVTRMNGIFLIISQLQSPAERKAKIVDFSDRKNATVDKCRRK